MLATETVTSRSPRPGTDYTVMPSTTHADILRFAPEAGLYFDYPQSFYRTDGIVTIDGIEVPRDTRLYLSAWLERGYLPRFRHYSVDPGSRGALSFVVGATAGTVIGGGLYSLKDSVFPAADPFLASIICMFIVVLFGAIGWIRGLVDRNTIREAKGTVHTVQITDPTMLDVRKRVIRIMNSRGVHNDLLTLFAAAGKVYTLPDERRPEARRAVINRYHELSAKYSSMPRVTGSWGG